MENLNDDKLMDRLDRLELKIEDFLAVSYGDGSGSGSGYGYGYGSGSGSGDGYGSGDGDGYGYGSGSGSGYGYGFGYGSGDGYGDGYGYGSGDGDGYGYGDGYGIKSINKKTIYSIDSIPTIINQIKNNIAKGAILNSDLTLTPCYVIKQNDLFAHGETLKEAIEQLQNKLFQNMSEDERICEFIKEHKWNTEYPNTDFFEWHHKLTGSCEMGRKSFAENNGINLNEAMTVEEFINLTKSAYGGNTIKKLKEKYKKLEG